MEDLQKRSENYKKILEKDWQTLIIFGGVGVGKTYLVRNYTPDIDYFIDEPTFKQHLTAGNMKLASPEIYWAAKYQFPLECLIKKKLIVYDDIGCSGHTTAYIEKMLFRVNKRKDRWLKTIITTNLTPQEFETTYEKRIASRLLENSISILLKWEDLRKKTSLFIEI